MKRSMGGMSIRVLLLLVWVLLVGCATPERTTPGPKTLPVGLRELLLMTPNATLEQMEAIIGPPPRRGRIVEYSGPFKTADDRYWIEKVIYYGEDRIKDIEIHAHVGPLGPCFPIEDLPKLIGAREMPPPIDGYKRTFRLKTKDLLVTFRAAYPERKCLEMIYLSRL